MRNLLFSSFILAGFSLFAATGPTPVRDGSYYGVNYTVPFAHAYRALGELGVDRKAAIDRDVYHMARLGLDAFRLHLWDVELSDGEGNLLENGNDHLELLDYLIAQLEKRGIEIVLTAQTNFGNGYPEHNTDPNGAFTYKYEKCDVHDNPAAQAAQERYLRALVSHVNPFTGESYADDPHILAIEINNEPCHSGTAGQITEYIDRMTTALRDAGWDKEILYNVSHNLDRVAGYYSAADLDGTTYQWYPTGLVHGSERHGNFLPMLDSYDIPWDTIEGFTKRSRVIYEYDPADVLATYLYPAAARSFRKAGFTWVTQFAYDPIDMARFNTEYQTHFLNLGYTPGKAIGMMIAAEVMRQVPKGEDYGKYPVDTIFGPGKQFTVSAKRNLSLLNDGERFYHTNTTDEMPQSPRKLRAVAGVGSSPLVTTDGTGAYFLDRLADGIWRLEIMPDVIITEDPFAKPSLTREVAVTTDREINMRLNHDLLGTSDFGPLYLAPGAYILDGTSKKITKAEDNKTFGLKENMRVNEYVAPISNGHKAAFVHDEPAGAIARQPLTLKAITAGNIEPDSIVVYPTSTSFWRQYNKLYKMSKTGKYEYSVTIPGEEIRGNNFGYRITVFNGDTAQTYPEGNGTPLDWDFPETASYKVRIAQPDSAIELLRPAPDMDGSELTTIPEGWRGVRYDYTAPLGSSPSLTLSVDDDSDTDLGVVTKYVAPTVKAFTHGEKYNNLRLYVDKVVGTGVKVGLVNDDGFTYTTEIPENATGIIDLPLNDFMLDSTVLAPAPFPAFLNRFFVPDPSTATALRPVGIEAISIRAPRGSSIEILGTQLTIE